MLRRIIAVLLIFSHMSVLTISCTDERTAGPEPPVSADKDVPALGAVNDPGQFHNDILRAFNHDNVLTSGERLDREAFVERFLEATNTILAERGMAVTIERSDVELILDRFEEYRSFGFFDFDSRDAGRLRAIDYCVERGDIDEIEAERLNGVFRELEQIGFAQSSQGRVHRLVSRHMNRGPIKDENQIVDRVLDVGDHSYQYWTDLLGETPTRGKGGGGPERINIYWLHYAYADMVAMVFFGTMGPFGVCASAAFSLAFYMAMHPGD